jgi:hypothetical protein
MEPRWKPSYAESGVGALEFKDDTFWGCANDLDIWWDDDREIVVVVGPKEKQVDADGDTNFDAFDIVDGTLKIQDGYVDLHIYVHDMCLIYALCVEKGVLDGKG